MAALALAGCQQKSAPEDRRAQKLAQRAARFTKRGENAQASPLILTWSNDINVGDCTIHKGAKFTLDSAGNNQWECDISSTDTGDEGLVRIFLYGAGFDPNRTDNQPLAFIGDYGFDIHDANTIKHWVQVFGPRAIFYNIGGLGPLELVQQTTVGECNCWC